MLISEFNRVVRHPMRIVLLCIVLSLTSSLLTSSLLTSTASADVKDAKVGDYLEVRVNNEWRKCKVLSVTRGGRQLRVKVDGTGQTLLYDHDRFRELKKDAREPKPNTKDGTADKPTGDRPTGDRPTGDRPKDGDSGKDAYRTWTDATGNFRIEAKFVTVENDAVKLVRKNGAAIIVPLAKLSTADREIATAMAAKMKSSPSEDDNPFKVDDSPGPMPKTDSGNPGKGDTAPATPRVSGSATTLTPGGRIEIELPSTVTPTDASKARSVIPSRPSKPTYEPDPVPARQIAEGAIGLPKKGDFFEKVTHFSLDHASAVAAVSRNASFGSKKGFCEIDLLDLGSARLLNTIAFSANANAHDIIVHEDSLRFVTSSSDTKRIDVWERNSAGLTHINGWLPFSDKKLSFAGFADPDHLLTIGDGKLVGWDPKTGQPTYSTKIKPAPTPIFSPGRKYLVAGHDLGLVILHAASGKVAAVIDDTGAAINTVRFSPDGTRLATLTTFRQLKFWNIADGTMLDEVAVPTQFTSGFSWPDENHLLINDQLLYDIERRIILWQYKGYSNDKMLTQVQDSQFVYVASSSDSRGVFSAVVPHAKPIALAKQLEPAELLILKPGAKVSIRMETNYTPGDNQKAYDALVQKLTENGVEVVQSGSLVFVAVSKKGKPYEASYRSIGSISGTTKRTVTPLVYSLTLYEGRDNVWATTGSGRVSFISMKRGESLDDALRRVSQPSPEFFIGLKMPKLLARQAPGKVAFGASEMAFGGMKPSEPDARK